VNESTRGFTLIEVVVVVAIIAISLSMAGPRIGAGIGRIELNQAAQTIRSFIKLARVQAQRSDREHYVILNKEKHSVVIVNRDLEVVREEIIPASVEFVLGPDVEAAALYVAPSGILRGQPIRLRGRTGEIEVGLTPASVRSLSRESPDVRTPDGVGVRR
jgi:prepilin-type N-terminal cleavage/methylation domain-containing protein